MRKEKIFKNDDELFNFADKNDYSNVYMVF